MSEPIDICSLDYLTGTLATAYKGVITSLVVRDFCITGEKSTAILKGTVLSMPEGDYQASLIHEGTELSRAKLRNGFFELRTDSAIVMKAKNLQIDIIQNGRHIGTFLLKREKKDEFFASAIELSQELKETNFKALASLLLGKVGLFEAAENIVSEIFSSKKDWRKLSENINSFSRDLYWTDRDAHYAWFRILSRYSIRSCENTDATLSYKPISNFLSLIEMPIEKETDMRRLRSLADIWLEELRGASIDLSYRFAHVARILSSIHKKFPDADMRPVLKSLLDSVETRLSKSPFIDEPMFEAMTGLATGDDLRLLSRYSRINRDKLLRELAELKKMLGQRDYESVLDRTDSLDLSLLNSTEMVDELFGVIERIVTVESAEKLSEILNEIFSLLDSLRADTYEKALSNSVRLFKKAIALNMTAFCETLLSHIEKSRAAKEDFSLDPGVALSLLRSEDERLFGKYKDILKQIIIPAPVVAGFSNETWAEIVDPRHLPMLTKFLRIISLDSNRFRDVLVHVICNLYVSGVFIPDGSLFQREVSLFMNSGNFMDNFLLNCMLLKKLPVYYSDIGATGRIRDYSTEIDSWGNDQILYFLRKQVHVNASNYNIGLVEGIIRAWVYNDADFLAGAVPEDVFQRLDRQLLARYSYGIRALFEHLNILESSDLRLHKLLLAGETELRKGLNALNITDEMNSKIFLLCRIYQEISKKYSQAGVNIEASDINLTLSNNISRLRELRAIMSSPEKTVPVESLYFKRHIAFGIPSVIGTYHETKFDALGEMLKVEEQTRIIFENIISGIGGKPDISENRLGDWLYCLDLMNELFLLHDLDNFQIKELTVILKTNALYLSQIPDMLKMWQRELKWMVGSLNNTFQKPLTAILDIYPENELPERLRGIYSEGGDFVNKAADIILRDIMNSVTGFLEMDSLINTLLDALDLRIKSGPDNKIGGDKKVTDKEFFCLDELPVSAAAEVAPLTGGKATNLAYLINSGLPVPAGVVFLAKHTQGYREYTGSAAFETILKRAVGKIEQKTGTVFGDFKKPLFLSIRSGSYISMPGILSSILYCGMNEKILAAFIDNTGNPWLGWDSYRRFIGHYGSIVHGIDAGVFENILAGFMEDAGIAKRKDISSAQMETIAGLYIKELSGRGLSIPDEVYAQLRESVRAVFGSWYAEKAEHFRKAMRVSERWGTAVTIMQMVCGNDRGSGASVFFTRNPLSLRKGIYGDTAESATGDDLVYGSYTNRPLTRGQAGEGKKSLEEIDPELFSMHEEIAEKIENAMGGLPQEVEVTYTEKPDGKRIICVLQTRRMESHRGFIKRFDNVCRLRLKIIGRGTGVNGGELGGIATFSSNTGHIKQLRSDSKKPVILLRHSANTNDVSLMSVVDGILTIAGGVASHASVLAQKFNLPAIVGCSDMEIKKDENGEPYAIIGNSIVREGTPVSIDGSTGMVYSGLCF